MPISKKRRRETSSGTKLERLELLLDRLVEIPEDWVKEEGSNNSGGDVQCLDCTSYEDMIDAWGKALKWTDGLDCALSVMLASITSTLSVGDPLWVKIISPPSGGKSVLCEALSVNRYHVIAKSTLRGFHSGFGDGQEDHSLISKVNGKTLVMKDGDTLLQSPNLSQILSEGRDLYDGASRTSYRNKASKDYTGLRMTWILCGTSSLRSIDSSELGERFLDCVIMDGIDEELEEEILDRVVTQAMSEIETEADGTPETQQSPEKTYAMGLTGGYIDFLKRDTQKKLSRVKTPQWALDRCKYLAKFVAILRARPSKLQDEKVEREIAGRIASQLVRLMRCLAFVLNKKEVDKEVIRRVTKVATDTARGKTFEIIKILLKEKQATPKNISMMMGSATASEVAKTSATLRFLRALGVTIIKPVKLNGVKNRSGVPMWRLEPKMKELFTQVMEGTDA